MKLRTLYEWLYSDPNDRDGKLANEISKTLDSIWATKPNEIHSLLIDLGVLIHKIPIDKLDELDEQLNIITNIETLIKKFSYTEFDVIKFKADMAHQLYKISKW